MGVAGDLYIAGVCLSVGYTSSPALTASKFLPDPRAKVQGERMYSTGNRARWRTEGWLEFLGRLDDQVKVLGYRIELGEVQSVLGRCPGVRPAAAVARTGSAGKAIIGFFVPKHDAVRIEDIKRHLRLTLPAYAMPARRHRHAPRKRGGQA